MAGYEAFTPSDSPFAGALGDLQQAGGDAYRGQPGQLAVHQGAVYVPGYRYITEQDSIDQDWQIQWDDDLAIELPVPEGHLLGFMASWESPYASPPCGPVGQGYAIEVFLRSKDENGTAKTEFPSTSGSTALLWWEGVPESNVIYHSGVFYQTTGATGRRSTTQPQYVQRPNGSLFLWKPLAPGGMRRIEFGYRRAYGDTGTPCAGAPTIWLREIHLMAVVL